jgi:hypothetical protein
MVLLRPDLTLGAAPADSRGRPVLISSAPKGSGDALPTSEAVGPMYYILEWFIEYFMCTRFKFV